MPVNPSIKPDLLNNPTERANTLNDPKFSNQQGYFPYDLTHSEYLTPRFGQIVPSMHLDTNPADRTVVRDNCKTILNQINGNMLSTVNQYIDSFYVPLRSLFPNNYEKLIPQPTKGSDLPNAALPQIPFSYLVYAYFNYGTISVRSDVNVVEFNLGDYNVSIPDLLRSYDWEDFESSEIVAVMLGRMALMATVLSRGQLLDYLGVSFDLPNHNIIYSSEFQSQIDRYFTELYKVTDIIRVARLEPNSDEIYLGLSSPIVYLSGDPRSLFRDALDDAFERGRIPLFYFKPQDNVSLVNLSEAFCELYTSILALFEDSFGTSSDNFIESLNSLSNPWQDGSFLNISKVLAYQQIVAHYYSNDSVDNIFTSDLFMQLLRGVMFPVDDDGFSKEPVFDYNGVSTEYDYITSGAVYYSLINSLDIGQANRQYIYFSLMFLLRRSLRYGDYFSTARPDMLAVGQLSINVSNGSVSPIDITKNLLMQRYKNAANYIGSGFPQYYASMYGVVPSDLGCTPRFLAHRKIVLQSLVTNNTAEDQGKQTTNLAGYSDDNAFDVYIDDLGVILSLMSFDVLPVYTSGIDSSYRFTDRFDYFNPMLQGIGDQPIRSSEILGFPRLFEDVFGYTMRNAEYKYKLSKAHGAFVNSLPGYLLRYPLKLYMSYDRDFDLTISSDYIRDKPSYLDSVVPQMTGISPAEYFHFVCAVVNQVSCARKIQATPPVLF